MIFLNIFRVETFFYFRIMMAERKKSTHTKHFATSFLPGHSAKHNIYKNPSRYDSRKKDRFVLRPFSLITLTQSVTYLVMLIDKRHLIS